MQHKPTASGTAWAAEGDLTQLSWLGADAREALSSYASGTCGLVLPGYLAKPFCSIDPPGDLLFSLIDNARIVVIDYAPALERRVSQVPYITSRLSGRIRTIVDLGPHDPEIAMTPGAERRLHVLDPVAN